METIKPYDVILIDCPWSYKNAAVGKRGLAKDKYPVLTVNDLAALPVGDLAAKDCLLAMWWVGPQPQEALDLVNTWGFKLQNMLGFTWGKRSKNWRKQLNHWLSIALDGSKPVKARRRAEQHVEHLLDPNRWFVGMGHFSRSNAEAVLFALRGRPKRLDAGVSQFIEAPVGKHSAKPAEVRYRLERLLGKARRLEIFASERVSGWDSLGLAIDGKDVRESIPALIERIKR